MTQQQSTGAEAAASELNGTLAEAQAVELAPPASPLEVVDRGLEADAIEDFDPSRRFLCPDGACIGLIDADGRCRLCSSAIAPHEVEAFEARFGVVLGPEIERAAILSPGSAVEAHSTAEQWAAEDDAADDPAFLEQRELCADGACIGVVGTDGRCRVCGLGAAPELG